MRLSVALFVPLVAMSVGGCASTRAGGVDPANRRELRRAAMECLKAAVHYEANPAVRVAGVEALESSAPQAGLAWIRLALHDKHPAVLFAACVAVGRLRDEASRDRVYALLAHDDANVRVASLFALHRLGDTTRTGKLATYLLEHEDVSVRRNTAMVLGFLGEPGAIKLLARAMRDGKTGADHYVLEAMAVLGNAEARQELTFMTNRGVGSEEVFAVLALARTLDPRYRDTFRYKLSTGTHLETKIAAAQALGMLGEADGFDLAMRALRSARPRKGDPHDPPEVQVLRVKIMALAALGAIGRTEALPALAKMLADGRDPRLQVAAARAVLDVLRANPIGAFPSDATGERRRR